ncbi:MAG: hypothetical protein R3D67_04935 [Hyphomicrobiaceae bacterium]
MTQRRLGYQDVQAILGQIENASSPREILECIGAYCSPVLGAKGYTMFRYLHASGEVERIHSSDPKAYPVGGRKRTQDYPQSQAILAKGEVYIAKDEADIRETYRDADLILSIGVTSIMNVPVRLMGKNVGAINVLGVAGQFTKENADDGRTLAGLMLPAVLRWDAD